MTASIVIHLAPTSAQAAASRKTPINWIAQRADGLGFVIPEGWNFEVDAKNVVAVDPGPSGACLVRGAKTAPEKLDAAQAISEIVATLKDPVVLSRLNDSGHATIDTRRMHEGKPRWTQIVADVTPLPGGGDTLELVVFETMDEEQYERYAEQEAPEVFLAGIHKLQILPANTFSGAWEGSNGQSAKALLVKGRAGETLDESWFFRLELLDDRRYRLTRILTSDAPFVAGWTATNEVGTFAVNGDAITLRRGTCKAIRAPKGQAKKEGACGIPLGALVLAQSGQASALIFRGVHLFDDRFGMGRVIVSRPRRP